MQKLHAESGNASGRFLHWAGFQGPTKVVSRLWSSTWEDGVIKHNQSVSLKVNDILNIVHATKDKSLHVNWKQQQHSRYNVWNRSTCQHMPAPRHQFSRRLLNLGSPRSFCNHFIILQSYKHSLARQNHAVWCAAMLEKLLSFRQFMFVVYSATQATSIQVWFWRSCILSCYQFSYWDIYLVRHHSR